MLPDINQMFDKKNDGLGLLVAAVVVPERWTIFLRFFTISTPPVLSSLLGILDGSQNIGTIGNAWKQTASWYLEGVTKSVGLLTKRHRHDVDTTCLERVGMRFGPSLIRWTSTYID
jgi:hypothetical protein